MKENLSGAGCQNMSKGSYDRFFLESGIML